MKLYNPLNLESRAAVLGMNIGAWGVIGSLALGVGGGAVSYGIDGRSAAPIEWCSDRTARPTVDAYKWMACQVINFGAELAGYPGPGPDQLTQDGLDATS
jgi:hypothetical protein